MNAIKTPDVARVTPANLIQLFLSFSSLIIFRLNIFLSGKPFSTDFVFHVIKDAFHNDYFDFMRYIKYIHVTSYNIILVRNKRNIFNKSRKYEKGQTIIYANDTISRNHW